MDYENIVIEVQTCYKGFASNIKVLDELVNSGWRVICQKTISYYPATAVIILGE